jgi:threonine dehydrogenase-like Zn-dependent dehydrogenase
MILRNGSLTGGQAEYLRVPHGDFNCLKLPEDAMRRKMITCDVIRYFPQDTMQQVAGVKPGDSVVIYGAGPVGLSLYIRQISKVPVRLWW